jgi:hypothetical protein
MPLQRLDTPATLFVFIEHTGSAMVNKGILSFSSPPVGGSLGSIIVDGQTWNL